MADEKSTDPEVSAEDYGQEAEGVQQGRKADDPMQTEQDPMDDHGTGDAGGSEAVGDGPSGGAPTGGTGGGDSSATGAGPSGGA